MRKKQYPGGIQPKKPADPKDAPPPYLYHLESYRQTKEFMTAQEAEQAEEANRILAERAETEAQEAVDEAVEDRMNATAESEKLLSSVDITSIDHSIK
jgi:hypothetical protein